MVVSEPGRGHALRARRLELRGLCDRHPQPAGVLLRRVRQPDQRRQRRRSPGRDRASRLHPERIRQRLAIELAVRQVHRREEQPLQRLDGRADVQAAVRRPGGAHRAAGGGVPQRPVGHGLQPGYRALRRVEELLLRLELSRCRRRRPHLRLQAEGRRRRVRARGRQGRPPRHPDRRHESRSRRRALPRRLDHRLGLEEQGAHLEARLAGCGREPDADRSPHAHRGGLRHALDSRRVGALAACRHADPSEGAVRARAARRRQVAPRRGERSGAQTGANPWHLGCGTARADGEGRGQARGAADPAPDRCRCRDSCAGGEDDRRPALRAGGSEPRAAPRRQRSPRPFLRGRGARTDRAQAGRRADRRDARRQRRQGRLPAPRRQPRALAHR